MPPVTACSLLALAVCAVTACGSAPSKDTYISRGDAICEQTAAAQAKIKAPAEGNLPGTASYLRQSADLVGQEVGKLRKLDRPAGDSGRLGDLLGREADAVAVLRKAATAAAKGDRKTADSLLSQAQGELSDVGAGLRDYGFGICGT